MSTSFPSSEYHVGKEDDSRRKSERVWRQKAGKLNAYSKFVFFQADDGDDPLLQRQNMPRMIPISLWLEVLISALICMFLSWFFHFFFVVAESDPISAEKLNLFLFTFVLMDNLQTIYRSSVKVGKRWKNGGFYDLRCCHVLALSLVNAIMFQSCGKRKKIHVDRVRKD